MKKANSIIICVVVLMLCFIIYSITLYHKRVDEMSQVSAGNSKAIVSNLSVTPIIEYKGKKYRKNTYMKAILLIGVDSSGSMEEVKASGSGGQADGIFLIGEDIARNRIKVLIIPRDTMTDITLTDLEGNEIGKDYQHITLAYAYGDGKEKSCSYLKKAVSDLLGGLDIDYYLAVNTSAIGMLNDCAGGVPVSINTEELTSKDPALKKGETVLLNGKQAEIFLRYRDVTVTNSALTRMDRQKQYMKAYMGQLEKKFNQDSNLIINLMQRLNLYTITDMNKNQYRDMVADILSGGQLLTDQDIFVVPGEGVATELYDEYHVDQDALSEIILKLFYRQVE